VPMRFAMVVRLISAKQTSGFRPLVMQPLPGHSTCAPIVQACSHPVCSNQVLAHSFAVRANPRVNP
jgi:hypothetical protein